MPFCRFAIPSALLSTLAAFFVARPASGCSVCGCDDPLVAASESAPNDGALRLALSASTVMASARSEDDPLVTERLLRARLTPTAVYSPLRNLNVLASMPLQRNVYSVTGSDVPSESHTLWGIGDAELGARYFVLSSADWAAQRRQEIALAAGSAFPTGPNAATADGERLDEHAQLGRGAFGPYLGASYAFHQDPWNFTVSAIGRTFTSNSHGYRYGSSLLWSAAVQYRPWDELAFELGTNDHYQAHDVQDGQSQTNTGGLVLQLSPGLLADVSGPLWFQARVDIPVYERLNGVQTLGPTYLTQLRYSF